MQTKKENFVAFFSYIHILDEQDRGRLSELRKMLQREVEILTGEPFTIFQDRNDIFWGQEWRKRIETTIDGCTYLIAVISPGYLRSSPCKKEFELFLEREKSLGRSELVLPIIYVETPEIVEKTDKIAAVIAERQYIDWTELRHEPLDSPEVKKSITALAKQIRDSIKGNSFRHSGDIPEIVKDVVEEIKNKQESLSLPNDSLIDELLQEPSLSAYDQSPYFEPLEAGEVHPILDQLEYNELLPPHLITVFLRPSGDNDRDRRRIKNVYGVLISQLGKDRFQFQVFENGKGHLIDFPNDTTRINNHMLNRLKKLIGEESWRIEEITYQ
jgi:hypothetical protein